jgi:hypothetical protein
MLFPVILSWINTSCKKEEDHETLAYIYIDTIKVNMEASAILTQKGKFNFLLGYRNGAGRIRIEMPIDNVPAKVGSHSLSPQSSETDPYAYFFAVDNDLALDDYILLEGENNVFSILNIDTEQKTVQATMEAVFIRDTLLSPVKMDSFPDTIRLTNTYFDLKYEVR